MYVDELQVSSGKTLDLGELHLYARAVKIDGTILAQYTPAQQSGYAGYTYVTHNVSSFADGGQHQVRFESSTYGGGGLTNFFVDDVSIPVCP